MAEVYDSTDIPFLETRQAELEKELQDLKNKLWVLKQATKPRPTKNRLIVHEEQVFYVLGYRNPRTYGESEWLIKFTVSARRLREEILVEKLRGLGEVKAWQISLADGRVYDKQPGSGGER